MRTGRPEWTSLLERTEIDFIHGLDTFYHFPLTQRMTRNIISLWGLILRPVFELPGVSIRTLVATLSIRLTLIKCMRNSKEYIRRWSRDIGAMKGHYIGDT